MDEWKIRKIVSIVTGICSLIILILNIWDLTKAKK